jgi:hypothetical protein
LLQLGHQLGSNLNVFFPIIFQYKNFGNVFQKLSKISQIYIKKCFPSNSLSKNGKFSTLKKTLLGGWHVTLLQHLATIKVTKTYI